MKQHRHTPEQIVRKLREGKRMLNEGTDITEVVRQLEIAESTRTRLAEPVRRHEGRRGQAPPSA